MSKRSLNRPTLSLMRPSQRLSQPLMTSTQRWSQISWMPSRTRCLTQWTSWLTTPGPSSTKPLTRSATVLQLLLLDRRSKISSTRLRMLLANKVLPTSLTKQRDSRKPYPAKSPSREAMVLSTLQPQLLVPSPWSTFFSSEQCADVTLSTSWSKVSSRI